MQGGNVVWLTGSWAGVGVGGVAGVIGLVALVAAYWELSGCSGRRRLAD